MNAIIAPISKNIGPDHIKIRLALCGNVYKSKLGFSKNCTINPKKDKDAPIITPCSFGFNSLNVKRVILLHNILCTIQIQQ